MNNTISEDGPQQPARMIHHLARTGGTLISRCIGVMQGVYLLSETNPSGTHQFNPLRQAHAWFGLVDASEVEEIAPGDEDRFRAAIALVNRRCAEQGGVLVLRDWSHVDFLGFPFNDTPTQELRLRESLLPLGGARSIATVRNPLDQYLSLKRLAVLQQSWDEDAVWSGIRSFAESIQQMPWIRYEDFVAAPEQVMQQMSEILDLKYDPSFVRQWHQYGKITGDSSPPKSNELRRPRRAPVPCEVWKQLAHTPDFFKTLDILGYPTPSRFRSTVVDCPRTGASEGKTLASAEKAYRESRLEDAVALFRVALRNDPGNNEATLAFADALIACGEQYEAYAKLQELLMRDPEHEAAIRAVVQCLESLEQRFEAIPYRRRLAKLRPDDLHNLFALANSLTATGAVDEALSYYYHLVAKQPGNDAAATNYLLELNYSDQYTAAEIANEHFRIGMRFTERPQDVRPRKRPPDGRIRIGYVSSDFGVHPVGKIIRGVFAHHDKSRFSIAAYSSTGRHDGLTEQLKSSVDKFMDVSQWEDERLIELITADQIDVLVDLGAYTAGGNRLRVFARRSAPIQISFLGYPNTSALQTIHYRVTDRFADPPGLTDRLYGEQSLWLDSGFLSWDPYDAVARVNIERSGGPRIGSFNNVAKISPSAIKCWAEILRRSPTASLVLKYGDRYGSQHVRDRFCREFAECGIRSERLVFMDQAKTLEGHLRSMADVDLALDSFPYQGTMTSLECLSVGTPILSLCGDYYAHRATSAMLMRLGLVELVADSTDEYVEIATQLLADLPMLRGMRTGLRGSFHSSTLANPAVFVEEWEATIRQLVEFAD